MLESGGSRRLAGADAEERFMDIVVSQLTPLHRQFSVIIVSYQRFQTFSRHLGGPPDQT